MDSDDCPRGVSELFAPGHTGESFFVSPFSPFSGLTVLVTRRLVDVRWTQAYQIFLSMTAQFNGTTRFARAEGEYCLDIQCERAGARVDAVFPFQHVYSITTVRHSIARE